LCAHTRARSPQFALRSYLYLLLHALFAAPASLLLGAHAGKRVTFHVVRAVLGAACASAEAALCRATARAAGRRLGVLLWAVLLASSGLFTSSTTLLPSTFTMVAFAAAAALCLDRRPLVRACAALLTRSPHMLRGARAAPEARHATAGSSSGVRRGRPPGLAVCWPGRRTAWLARHMGGGAAAHRRGGGRLRAGSAAPVRLRRRAVLWRQHGAFLARRARVLARLLHEHGR
jgi:hypothetical protein